MEQRHQGSALTAGRHVGGAEIVHHGDAGQSRQQRPVADLPCPALVGRMEDRMAMEADQIDAVRFPASRLTASACSSVNFRSTSPRDPCRPGNSAASRGMHRRRGSSDERRFQQRRRRRADHAASIPSSDVPLIRPRAVRRGGRRHGFTAVAGEGGRTTGRLFPTAPRRCRKPRWFDPALYANRRALTKPCIKPWNSVMSDLRSEFLRTRRGARLHPSVHGCGRPGRKLASEGIVTAYIGYDCTADSLHVGHLVSIMMLRLLQRTGHKPVVLMGGGTTKIGDPTGRDESRKMLDRRADRRQHGQHQAGVRPVPDLRRRPDRRRHGQQRRLAGKAANTSRSCATWASISRSTAC